METAAYITVDEILFTISGNVGDRNFNIAPRGYYISLISDCFQQLNMDSFFVRAHKDYKFPHDDLTLNLPDDCFNVKNVWVFDGDKCNFNNARKVEPKRNYFTAGNGYFANVNDRNGHNDPIYGPRNILSRNRVRSQALVRINDFNHLDRLLYYSIQNGNIMFSSSCRNAGTKVHIDYNSTGGPVGEAPIIPLYFKTAIEDYATEAGFRFRMANEPSNAKSLAYLQQTYAVRLDKDGMNGSWHKAVMKAKNMSSADREAYGNYMSRAAAATGR